MTTDTPNDTPAPTPVTETVATTAPAVETAVASTETTTEVASGGGIIEKIAMLSHKFTGLFDRPVEAAAGLDLAGILKVAGIPSAKHQFRAEKRLTLKDVFTEPMTINVTANASQG